MTQLTEMTFQRRRREPDNGEFNEMQSAVEQLPPEVSALAADEGFGEESLTLQIDRKLNHRVWLGTRYEDRAMRQVGNLGRTLVTEIERSLLGQEQFDDFEQRMQKLLGIDRDHKGRALLDMNNQLQAEVRLAYNETMASVNQQTDTILVSRAQLDESTTPTCWRRHGVSIEEIGETPQYHFGCRCDVLTVPNPESVNADWAKLGQSILADMKAEREESEPVAREVDAIPSRLFKDITVDVPLPCWLSDSPESSVSRFASFREMAVGVLGGGQ